MTPAPDRAAEVARLLVQRPMGSTERILAIVRELEARVAAVARAESQMRAASTHALVSREAGRAFQACADDLKAILETP